MDKILDFKDYQMNKDNFITNEENNRVSYTEYLNMINEAWASKKIMPLIAAADKNSDRAWYKSFIKDFYKVYNFSIDKIEDSDFVESNDPSSVFVGKLRKEEIKDLDKKELFPGGKKYLAIFINDDKNLEIDAEKDLNNMERALKKLGLEDEDIDKLSDAMDKGVKFFKKAFTTLAKSKEIEISLQEAENVFTEYDQIRRLKTPVITSIVLGGHAVFHGFEMINQSATEKRRQAGIPWKQDRYGVLHSPVLINRYFGLKTGTDVNKNNLPSNTTKVFYVDVEALADKYDMGTKLKDRENYKQDNPAFMSPDDLKKDFQKRVQSFKRNHVDPESVLKMFKATFNGYQKAYSKAITDIENIDDNKIISGEISLAGNTVKSGTEILKKTAEIQTNYIKLYNEYNKFMKSLGEGEYERYSNAKITDILNPKERKVSDQLNGYNTQLIEFKDRATELYDEMVKLGVTFTKTEQKLFNN